MSLRSRLIQLTLATLASVPLAAQSAAALSAPDARQTVPSATTADATRPHANPTPSVAGPRAENARAGVREATPAPVPAPGPTPRPADSPRNRALMIVGGAALIVGAVVGDKAGSIIMVSGAVVGLYGLYKFLE